MFCEMVAYGLGVHRLNGKKLDFAICFRYIIFILTIVGLVIVGYECAERRIESLFKR